MTKNSPAIACTLSKPEERAQRSTFRRDLAPFLENTVYEDGRSQLSFSRPEVTRNTLEQLIASEKGCCAFLDFELSETDAHFHLTVSGPKGSEDIIRSFFPLRAARQRMPAVVLVKTFHKAVKRQNTSQVSSAFA